MTSENVVPSASGAGSPGQEVSHEHADVAGGWLRPAVFGAMDGLVSNVALDRRGGGRHRPRRRARPDRPGRPRGPERRGLLDGGGEYTSVASQTEAAEREIAKERREIIANDAGETAELAAMYEAGASTPSSPPEVARQIHRDLDTAVAVHAREELGIDPDDLASPMLAAVSSFLAFAVGAPIPLLPYLVGGTRSSRAWPSPCWRSSPAGRW